MCQIITTVLKTSFSKLGGNMSFKLGSERVSLLLLIGNKINSVKNIQYSEVMNLVIRVLLKV